MPKYPSNITLEEQGLRDGLQSEQKIVPAETKVAYIERLVEAGLKRIQVCSFVNPKLVPQMADAEEVCRQLDHSKEVIYSGLVLNLKGVERAVSAGLKHIAISISASDTHSLKNANKPLAEARSEFKKMVKEAKNAGLKVRGGIQNAFGCRYEGWVNPDFVLELVNEHLETGIDEIALADSTGMGNPLSIGNLMEKVVELAAKCPSILHLHDTEGKGMANLLAGMQAGVRIFDTAFGGLGGCPFIKGATGNIATEDVAWMLFQMGIKTGLDIRKIVEISDEMQGFLNHRLEARITSGLYEKNNSLLANKINH